MDDLRCRKHDAPLVPNGQGDWFCEQSQEGEEGCDNVTLAGVLSRVKTIVGFVTY